MRLFALDPGVRSGFAEGEAGTIPLSGAVTLKKRGETLEKAAEQLGCFLRDRWDAFVPDLLVIEHYLAPHRQKNAAAAISSLLLNGAARAMAGIYGIPVADPTDSTVRKHFCGKGKAGTREDTNRMVVRQAITLGYVPRDCTDWDRCNAVSLFDWASFEKAGKRPAKLVMFGETTTVADVFGRAA